MRKMEFDPKHATYSLHGLSPQQVREVEKTLGRMSPDGPMAIDVALDILCSAHVSEDGNIIKTNPGHQPESYRLAWTTLRNLLWRLNNS